MTAFNIILFDDFEILDAFGPAEVIGKLPNTYSLGFYSFNGGIVTSTQKLQIQTLPFSEMDESGILLIPGGMGTRNLIHDIDFINSIKLISEKALYVLTVCTGSALLAKTGLLDGKNATSNKMAFDWVTSCSEHVNWIRKARWVSDGKFYTSSGVSAGIDMALGFISDLHGEDTAIKTAGYIEYIWNSDKNNDPFCKHDT